MFDGDKVKAALSRGSVHWRKHALERMLARDISRKDVEEVLRANDQIESYPDDSPFPSALFLGSIKHQAVHVVAALDEATTEVYVISAYRPDLEHFEEDFRTRRRRRES